MYCENAMRLYRKQELRSRICSHLFNIVDNDNDDENEFIKHKDSLEFPQYKTIKKM